MERDAINRFGSRVEHYRKYRPGYPRSIIDFLKLEVDLQPSAIVADIGSGTGISTELFLSAGNQVYGIEPNAEMRQAAENYLSAYSGFVSVEGKAEATGLPDNSTDVIVSGQAFHWFNRDAAKKEFVRILRPNGWVLLMWNERRQDSSFANAYEKLLKTYAIDYEAVDHRLITPEVLQQFYGSSRRVSFKMFDNHQDFALEGLQGRVMSCSYMPMRNQPGFDELMRALAELFERFQEDGLVKMNYNTLLYYGRIV